MANLIHYGSEAVHVEVKISRGDFEALVAHYGSRGRALRAMREGSQQWIRSLSDRPATSTHAQRSAQA